MAFNIKEKTSILLGLYVASLIIANVLGAKITSFDVPSFIATPLNIIFYPLLLLLNTFLQGIGGREIAYAFFNTVSVSVGILTFPLLFLITDVVEEVRGRKKVMEFIVTAAIALALLLLITAIAVVLPPAARSIDNTAYTTIFTVTMRITLASLLAFAIAQLHDMWSFEFWRKKTKGKYLWLRNNASTIVSQLIDSTIFMFVAFYKTTPAWDAVFVISLIIPYWLIKILFSLLDTPLVYAGVWWLRGKSKKVIVKAS